MKKEMFILSVVLGLCCSTVLAQEQEKKAGSGIASWLKGLQQKISQIAPRKSVVMTTGVAGVRGSKEDSQVKLYWKGKKGEEAVTEEELAEFKEAVDYASKGDRAGAIQELEEFMKQYPDSPLIPDAKKTLDLVKAEPEAVPAAGSPAEQRQVETEKQEEPKQ
jgi:TolA-binding protein